MDDNQIELESVMGETESLLRKILDCLDGKIRERLGVIEEEVIYIRKIVERGKE